MLSSDLLWMLGTIGLIYLNQKSAQIYIGFRACTLLVSLLVAGWFAWRLIHPEMVRNYMQRALKASFPYATSEFLMMSSLRIDILIVAFYLGDQAAGLYSPAVGMINALFLPLSAISGVILPILSNQFNHNTMLAWKSAKRAIWLFALLGAVFAIAMSFLAQFTTVLLGSSYSESQEIVLILSIILLIHAMIVALTNILIATDQQAKRAIIQTAAVIFNIVLDVFVVQRAGIRGAAWGYVITEVFMLIGLSFLVISFKSHSDKTPIQVNIQP